MRGRMKAFQALHQKYSTHQNRHQIIKQQSSKIFYYLSLLCHPNPYPHSHTHPHPTLPHSNPKPHPQTYLSPSNPLPPPSSHTNGHSTVGRKKISTVPHTINSVTALLCAPQRTVPAAQILTSLPATTTLFGHWPRPLPLCGIALSIQQLMLRPLLQQRLDLLL